MSDREELVKQFSDVTGVSEDRAKFYLEAANGELQVSLLRVAITKESLSFKNITWNFVSYRLPCPVFTRVITKASSLHLLFWMMMIQTTTTYPWIRCIFLVRMPNQKLRKPLHRPSEYHVNSEFCSCIPNNLIV